MPTPLFSVVTIAVDCANQAEATARSVLAQDFADYEYIVKDGRSTDGTPERLAALGVPCIISTPDDGIYDAMNQALANCRGEYVCFMNAGDVFLDEHTLGIVARCIDTKGHPDLLYGDIRSFVTHPDTTLRALSRDGRLICYPSRLGRFYLYRKMICHQAWYLKREVYVQHGFSTDLKLLADYLLLLQLVLDNHVSYAHIPAVVAVFDGTGATGKQSRTKEEERDRVLRSVYGRAELALYNLAFKALQQVYRRVMYPLVYPLLPDPIRGKANGF